MLITALMIHRGPLSPSAASFKVTLIVFCVSCDVLTGALSRAGGQAVFLWKRYHCLNTSQVPPPTWRLESKTKTWCHFCHRGLTHFEEVTWTHLLFINLFWAAFVIFYCVVLHMMIMAVPYQVFFWSPILFIWSIVDHCLQWPESNCVYVCATGRHDVPFRGLLDGPGLHPNHLTGLWRGLQSVSFSLHPLHSSSLPYNREHSTVISHISWRNSVCADFCRSLVFHSANTLVEILVAALPINIGAKLGVFISSWVTEKWWKEQMRYFNVSLFYMMLKQLSLHRVKRVCFKTLVDEVQELEALSKDPGAVVQGKRYAYEPFHQI